MQRRIIRSLLLACTLGVAGASNAADTPAGPAAAHAALAAYARYAYRYQGTLDAPGLAGNLLIALGESPDGSLAGEAILLGPNRTIRAVSNVSGRLDRRGCRIAMSLDPGTLVLDGTCTPTLLAGRFSHAPPSQDLIGRLLFWWGGRSTHGEAWLPAGGAI